MRDATVTIFEVLADIAGPGPACDGTQVYRFRTRPAAESFARGRTCYGRPAEALAATVPTRLARRWGC
jgi:hypothetical protein